jgi:alkanesulfonate monooxygenase SsuD/methylene tetrahydromethanopterin reductase-like flavin-dependent oxidoreductase (luciferase family)
MSTRRPSIVLSLTDPAQAATAANHAEAVGFESVWPTEFVDHSATIALAAMAGRTSRITIGSAFAYAFGRTPLVLAAEARDLDTLSDGRLILGPGTGTRRTQRDWHGLDGRNTVQRVWELVGLLRRLISILHAEPVVYDGQFYHVAISPTAPIAAPRRARIPIYLAGVNTAMIEAAGAVADGLIGHPLFTRSYVEEVVRPALDAGTAAAERPHAVPISGYITCSVHDDGEVARRNAKAVIAFNSTVKTYDAIHRHHGFEPAAAAVRAAWASRNWEQMIDAVSDRMLDAIAIAGTPAQARAQYQQRFAGLYERALLWPPACTGLEGALAVIDAFGQPQTSGATSHLAYTSS